jgi:hypothetical protein
MYTIVKIHYFEEENLCFTIVGLGIHKIIIIIIIITRSGSQEVLVKPLTVQLLKNFPAFYGT